MTFDYNLKEDEYLKAIKLYTRKFTKTGKRKIRITYFAGLVLLVTSAYMFISIFKQYLSFKQSLPDYVGECKIFCVNEKIHTKKEVASVE